MKQNAQTNQTKPTKKSNETQTNPRPNAHTRHNREREIARGKESVRERERKRGSDLWWLTERFETVAVAIGSRSGGGVDERRRWRRWEAAVAAWCWEWGFVWESREESDRSKLGGESELGHFFNLGFFCCWEVLLTYWGFWLFFFIYTKPRVAFYKTQLRMNWSCVLLNAAL